MKKAYIAVISIIMGISIVIPVYPNPENTADIENRDISVNVLEEIVNEVGSIEAAIDFIIHRKGISDILKQYIGSMENSDLKWEETTPGHMKRWLRCESNVPIYNSQGLCLAFGASSLLGVLIGFALAVSSGCSA